MEVQTTAGGELVIHRFPTTQPAVTFTSQGSATLGQQVRLYADAGDIVILTGSRNITAGSALSFHHLRLPRGRAVKRIGDRVSN